MKTLIFDAPPHHKLILDPDKPDEKVQGGVPFEVSEHRAAELLKNPRFKEVDSAEPKAKADAKTADVEPAQEAVAPSQDEEAEGVSGTV